jgi:hypothetical protein
MTNRLFTKRLCERVAYEDALQNTGAYVPCSKISLLGTPLL